MAEQDEYESEESKKRANRMLFDGQVISKGHRRDEKRDKE